MSNTPISASVEQKPATPASNPQQTQGNPQQGNKPSTDKPAGQPQQK